MRLRGPGGPANLSSLPLAGAFFWMMLLYMAIRYGVNDRVTHLVLAFAGMITAVVYAWGPPIALAICIVLGLCVLTASAIGREYRRAAMVLPNATHKRTWSQPRRSGGHFGLVGMQRRTRRASRAN